jgi:hypothetical protein
MPAEHGCGLHDEEGLSPSGNPPTGENPEPAITGPQPGAGRPALQHDQLGLDHKPKHLEEHPAARRNPT